MLSRVLLILTIWCGLDLASGEYRPVLTWDVCSPSRMSVTLTGAADGGIIYIKGYGAACKQTTTSAVTQHEFDFNACGINTAETYFTIIVQKNPLYQTGADLQESLLCIYDLSDISVNNNVDVGRTHITKYFQRVFDVSTCIDVGNAPNAVAVNVAAKGDDAGINKTVKPTVQMKLYSDGLDIGDNSVKLSDLVTMTIQVDEEFIADFDIKAVSCTANFIDIITNDCVADTELFPGFTHVTRGVITATFAAFRTTDLGSGLVEMVFSCTVQVCLAACPTSACDTGRDVSGRRRKRAVEGATYDEVNVGASLSVGERVEVKANGPLVTGEICLNTIVFVVVLTLLVAVVVTSMAMTSYSTSQLVQKSTLLRKCSNQSKVERATLRQQQNASIGAHDTTKRRLSTVSVISTNSSSPVPTLTSIENTRTSGKHVNPPTSGRKASFQKQASVSIVFSPQTVDHTCKRPEAQPKNHSSNRPQIQSYNHSNSTSETLTQSQPNETKKGHGTSEQEGFLAEAALNVSAIDLAIVNKGGVTHTEQVKKLDELKAAKNELMHYKKLLEHVGMTHLAHKS